MEIENHTQSLGQEDLPQNFRPQRVTLMTRVLVFQWIALCVYIPTKMLVLLGYESDFIQRMDLIGALALGLAAAANILVFKYYRKSMIFVRRQDLGQIDKILEAQGFRLIRQNANKRKYHRRVNLLLRFKAVVKFDGSKTTLTYPESLDEKFSTFKLY